MHKIANSSNRSSRSNSIIKEFKSSKALRQHITADDVNYCNKEFLSNSKKNNLRNGQGSKFTSKKNSITKLTVAKEKAIN